MLRIPYGKTISYRELAKRAGKPKAWRAAGAAAGRNPLPIVVPCHRVIGSNGRLTGFSSGIRLKEYLLQLEAAKSGKEHTNLSFLIEISDAGHDLWPNIRRKRTLLIAFLSGAGLP